MENFKDEDFDLKIKNEKVSVVKFTEARSGTCKNLKPIIDKISETDENKNHHYYIADIEEGGINTASMAGIRGVPTVIIYKKGNEVNRLVGGVPEGKMKEFLDENI